VKISPGESSWPGCCTVSCGWLQATRIS